MSKIGNRPIVTTGVQVTVKDNEIHFKGKNHSGVYKLSDNVMATVEGDKLYIRPAQGKKCKGCEWGLHRALMANAIKGALKDFESAIEINGLGFKVQASGKNLIFSLGYTHKITMELPDEVKLSVDKTGQKLLFTSFDKEKLGHVCALVRSLRPPEPYKGTGVKLASETIARKAGKAKAGAAAGGAA